MRRLVRAYSETIAIYKGNRDVAMQTTSKYKGVKNPATLSSTVNFYAPKLTWMPYPTVRGIHFVLHQVIPRAKTVAPESLLIDMRLVKRFEDSGFIRQLVVSSRLNSIDQLLNRFFCPIRRCGFDAVFFDRW